MIALHMNRTDYENDIRALLMAFFYGEKIMLDADDWTHRMNICYFGNKVDAEMMDRNGKKSRVPCAAIFLIIKKQETG